jgi:glycosyltransferase involved in cell wall biosynthesis
LDSKKIKIIVAGTIVKNKNHLTTLAACKILLDRGYDVQFMVVGHSFDNALRAKLVRERIIQYIPNQPKEELIKLYRGSDIYVMPSVKETFGLAYAEAMSQGLPLIYTRGQGFDQQFEDGQVGYSVSCFDPQEITDRIVMIIENYESISRRCVTLAHKFDWNNIAQVYTRIYREIVS